LTDDSELLTADSFQGRQQTNEGPCISEEDLREVQGDYAPRCGAGDLRERKA
jgi:hypothetical protein